MSVKEETNLQLRIQRLVKAQGGYITKNHGSMISEPGEPDLTGTYKGYSFYWEVKILPNKPSREQGIKCRQIMRAGGQTAIITSLKQAELLLSHYDYLADNDYGPTEVRAELTSFMERYGIDNGTEY